MASPRKYLCGVVQLTTLVLQPVCVSLFYKKPQPEKKQELLLGDTYPNKFLLVGSKIPTSDSYTNHPSVLIERKLYFAAVGSNFLWSKANCKEVHP